MDKQRKTHKIIGVINIINKLINIHADLKIYKTYKIFHSEEKAAKKRRTEKHKERAGRSPI